MTAADVIFVGCTKTKRAERSTARDLYDPSDLFRRRRTYAEASGRPWMILSAAHGAIDPGFELGPYDMTIQQRRHVDPRGWAIGSIQAAFRAAGLDARSDEIVIEVHAGIDYVRTLELALPAFGDRVSIEHPVAGMMIGEQKAHYSTPTEHELPELGLQLSLAF